MRAARRFIGTALETVSPLGWTVGALGFLMWVAGAYWGWRELLVVAAMALALILLSIPFTVGQLDLESEIGVAPSRVVVGERAAGELAIRNRRSRAARNIRVELPVGKAVAVFAVPRLAGGGETDELFVVPTNKRAVIPVGPVSTVKGDPVGILRRTQIWSGVDEIYVHPKTVRVAAVSSSHIRDIDGQETNQLSQSDIAFHTMREYVPGDDRRHIHWKSSAKFGELMVKQYVDSRRSHVAVAMSSDLADYENEDEFELAVSCAASVGVQALNDGQALSAVVGTRVLPTRDPRSLLDRWSAVEPSHNSGGIEQAVASLKAVVNQASVFVVCVGSKPSTADIRRATMRVPTDAAVVIVRAALGAKPGFHTVGSTKFVIVPELAALSRSLEAVAW